MKRNLLLIVLLAAIVQLSGCATNREQEPSVPVIDTSEPSERTEVKPPEKPPTPAVPTAPAPQTRAVPPVGNAVVSLAAQARAQYAARNYQGAVATAERGLRIDRRAPELYLILAQSYVQLANTQLAQQFVQQGIRYSQAGTEIAQSLLSLRDSLAK